MDASTVFRRLVRNRYLYALLAPGILYFVLFRYVPMWGMVIAFQDYHPVAGVAGSEWVGWKHVIRLFQDSTFYMLLRNTLVLFVLSMVFYFPVPILLALMLNEVRISLFKRSVQTIIYIPHFFSWIIVVSLTYVLLSSQNGIVNDVLVSFGLHKINFLLSEGWFRPLFVMQTIWKEAGWGTIIFLAAISGVDPQLYEAARMDGVNRFRQIWHITLPGIRNVIVIMIILRTGNVLELNFDHIYVMLNAMNRSVAEVFDTYIYTSGIQQGQFSYSTAVGLFRNMAGLVMVLTANWLSKRFGDEGIF